MMKRFDRTIPPVSAPPSKAAFPPFVFECLMSGAPVYIVENHLQPLVSISLYTRHGALTDIAGMEGRASLAMEMLTKGTTNRSAPQIAETIDSLGGSLGSNAGYDAATVSLSVLSKFLPQALDLMVDIVFNPTFLDEEFERLKLQRLASIAHGKSDPNYLADSLYSKLIYAPHPYSFEQIGTESSLEKITTGDLREHHRRIFRPDDIFFIVAGDVTPKEISAELDSRFTIWSTDTTPGVTMPPIPPEQQKVRVAIVEKTQAVQTALRLGHKGIHRAHEDYVKCYGMNMILGGYFNSRINQNLRERNGFTYGARSHFDARKQTGSFLVSTEIRTEVTAQTVRETLGEMERMRAEFVTHDELTTMKNYIIGSFPMTIETPQQVGSRLAALPLYGLASDYYDRFREWVAELTVEDVRTAAQQYLDPEHALIAVSGDTATLREHLSAFATVEEYDHNYERIQ